MSLLHKQDLSYYGHVKPKSGDAQDIAQSIWNFLRIRNLELPVLTGAGTDGKAKNIDQPRGVTLRFKEFLDHPLSNLFTPH